MKTLALQSAMEYLMTYGWAILIIAVVLGALFGLGFFNSANLAPKVAAGACQVYRPQGPGTTSFINLEGTCNNELPQYVAKFNGYGANYILTPTSSGLSGYPNGFTWSIWVLSNNNWANSGGSNSGNPMTQYMAGGEIQDLMFGFDSGHPGMRAEAAYSGCTAHDIGDGITNTAGRWMFYVMTYNGVVLSLYTNGADSGSSNQPCSLATAMATSGIYIGGGQTCFCTWNGMIANVQVYNTSLSSNEVMALYQGGIGGTPLSLDYLVGWWPLNGNANDYSGNLNNGAINGAMSFTSSWTSSYTAP